jgi:hypothetical protein
MRTSVETYPLVILPPGRARTTATVYLSQPTPLEMKNLGQLFMVVEILSDDKNNAEIIRLLQEEIEIDYYSTDTFDIERAFEKALQQTNQRIHEVIKESTGEWLNKLQIFIGVIKESTLHFSQLGNMNVFLIHQNKIVDIVEHSSGVKDHTINPLKIFSNIVSGTLSVNDLIFVCSSSLLDYLSLEKIRRTLGDGKLGTTIKNLERLLSENTNDTTFVGLAIKLIAEQDKKEAPAAVIPMESLSRATQDSMKDMVIKEARTSELLSPSLWRLTGNKISRVFQTVVDRQTVQPTRTKPLQQEDAFDRAQRETHAPASDRKSWGVILIPILKRIGRGILITVIFIGSGFVQLFARIQKLMRGRQRVVGNLRTLPHHAGRKLGNGMLNLKGLNRQQKIVIGVAILLIFFFAAGIIRRGQQQEVEAQMNAWKQQLTQAEELQFESENTLLYQKDEDAARDLLNRSRDLVNQVPETEEELQAQRKSVLEKINETSKKVDHVVEVTDLKTIADLTSANPTASPQVLLGTSSTLFSADGTLASIYRVGISDQRVATISSSDTTDGFRAASLQSETSALFLDQALRLRRATTTEPALSAVTFKAEGENSSVQSMEVYNDRLYTLQQNGIFRYPAAEEGFGGGTSWISDGADVSDGVSMTIDGNLYMLKGTGEVWKFTQGKRDATFATSAVEPGLGGATRIFTASDSSPLYVLDPKNQRVVVFGKDGKLIQQYHAAGFDQLRDLVVQESSGLLYLLNGQKILEVKLVKP